MTESVVYVRQRQSATDRPPHPLGLCLTVCAFFAVSRAAELSSVKRVCLEQTAEATLYI